MRIMIDGAFTDEEALALLQKVREIEQTRPERHITVQVVAPDRTREEARELLARVNPPFAYRIEVEGRMAVGDRPPFSND